MSSVRVKQVKDGKNVNLNKLVPKKIQYFLSTWHIRLGNTNPIHPLIWTSLIDIPSYHKQL